MIVSVLDREGAMEKHIKTFDQLTTEELYALIHLREKVFVVEQQCAYLDADGHDIDAVHVWLSDERGIVAYCRVLDRGAAFEDVSLGRVIAVYRREGLGTQVVRLGIDVARERFRARRIVIEAQTYARKLYENLGFRQTSDEFLEDGIPHIQMTLNL